ncbi:MAG TPA: hypothetical protein VMD02_02240 [Candidatus Omnitrophota bacterium]|nr:hypothetical protein [Candidatus Omnitrophota bacterium]
MSYDLCILDHEKELFYGKAEAMTAEALDGELTVLTGHAPIMTMLKAGTIRIKTPEDRSVAIEVPGGLLKVRSNQVAVLCG